MAGSQLSLDPVELFTQNLFWLLLVCLQYLWEQILTGLEAANKSNLEVTTD